VFFVSTQRQKLLGALRANVTGEIRLGDYRLSSRPLANFAPWVRLTIAQDAGEFENDASGSKTQPWKPLDLSSGETCQEADGGGRVFVLDWFDFRHTVGSNSAFMAARVHVFLSLLRGRVTGDCAPYFRCGLVRWIRRFCEQSRSAFVPTVVLVIPIAPFC